MTPAASQLSRGPALVPGSWPVPAGVSRVGTAAARLRGEPAATCEPGVMLRETELGKGAAVADAAHTARAMWTLFEPIHAVTYFAPEARGAYEEAGLRGFWRGYFAGRAAPLGPAK